ncbi:MAG: PilW family protein [Limnohabitans sp.]
MKPTRRSIGGFTLIELIVAIMLIGVLASALMPLAATSVRAYQASQTRVLAQDKLRYAMERMSRELREVSYTSASGFDFVGLTTTNPVSSLSFQRTYYGVNPGNATVTLSFAGSALTLTDSGYTALGAQTLCDTVSSVQFKLLDEAGQVLSSPSKTNVYAVEIVVLLNANGANLTQSTTVELKNRLRV